MKKLFLFLICFVCALAMQAQKVYFIYLQSENNTPFFVKMGEKIISSTASGYVILSGLKDSTYSFAVGFPGKVAESKFSVSLNNEDKGFLLKNFEGGLGLFDLQALTISRAIAFTKEPEPIDPALVLAADPFTRLLAQASDDASLYLSGPHPSVQKEQVTIVKEEPKTETNINVAPVASLPVATNTAVVVVAIKKEADPKEQIDSMSVINLPKEDARLITPVANETVAVPVTEEPYQRSVVKRRSESSTTEGFGLVFFDTQSGQTDTIRLLIPNPKLVAKIDEPIPLKKEAEPAVAAEIKTIEAGKVASKKPGCESMATEKDFLKLRRNMAAEESDESMMEVAKKMFEEKCFSTDQVKNLSALFLTPSGKYHFFVISYDHVSDKTQFAVLQSEIKEEAFVKRFKTLIGE